MQLLLCYQYLDRKPFAINKLKLFSIEAFVLQISHVEYVTQQSTNQTTSLVALPRWFLLRYCVPFKVTGNHYLIISRRLALVLNASLTKNYVNCSSVCLSGDVFCLWVLYKESLTVFFWLIPVKWFLRRPKKKFVESFVWKNIRLDW